MLSSYVFSVTQTDTRTCACLTLSSFEEYADVCKIKGRLHYTTYLRHWQLTPLLECSDVSESTYVYCIWVG